MMIVCMTVEWCSHLQSCQSSIVNLCQCANHHGGASGSRVDLTHHRSELGTSKSIRVHIGQHSSTIHQHVKQALACSAPVHLREGEPQPVAVACDCRDSVGEGATEPDAAGYLLVTSWAGGVTGCPVISDTSGGGCSSREGASKVAISSQLDHYSVYGHCRGS